MIPIWLVYYLLPWAHIRLGAVYACTGVSPLPKRWLSWVEREDSDPEVRLAASFVLAGF